MLLRSPHKARKGRKGGQRISRLSTIVNGILLVIAFAWINFLAVRSLERDRSRLLYDLYDDDEGGACGSVLWMVRQ